MPPKNAVLALIAAAEVKVSAGKLLYDKGELFAEDGVIHCRTCMNFTLLAKSSASMVPR